MFFPPYCEIYKKLLYSSTVLDGGAGGIESGEDISGCGLREDVLAGGK